MRALNRPGDFSSFFGGATGTRAGRGKPLRWAEGWVVALRDIMGIDNVCKRKKDTRERTMLVQTLLEGGRLHGHQMC